MNKLRSISDVYSTGDPYKHVDIPVYQQSTNLHEAYQLVKESSNPNVLSPDAIFLITGIDADVIMNFYRYIIGAGTLKYVLDNVDISVGSPDYRAVNQKLQGGNYNDLANFVKQISDEREDSLKITTSANTKKLRTPSGGRVCEWASGFNLTEALKDPASYPIDNKRGNTNLFRILAIVHLMHELGDHLEQIDKMPAGISYEIDQIDTFNKDLEDLPPLGFILPGSRDLHKDKNGEVVRINGAANVEGTAKAHMSLTLNGEENFWISYKHGEYVEDVTKPSQIPFQQYGSPGGIYGDEDLKPTVDRFLTEVSSSIGNYYSREDVIKIGEKNHDAPPGSIEKIMNVYGKQLAKVTAKGQPYKNIWNKNKVEHFHIYPSGTPEIASKLFDKDSKPLGSKLELIGLKSIYGDDYSNDSDIPFGINNVNILLQTPQSAKFEILRGGIDDPDEAIAVKLTMVEKSHIIKNPELPDAVPYLPCMYIRHTIGNFFIFKNTKTNRTEAILGGRLLVYPQGSASPNAKWVSMFTN